MTVTHCDHTTVAHETKLAHVYGYPDCCNQTVAHSLWQKKKKKAQQETDGLAFDGRSPVITKSLNGLLKAQLINVKGPISLSTVWMTLFSQTVWTLEAAVPCKKMSPLEWQRRGGTRRMQSPFLEFHPDSPDRSFSLHPLTLAPGMLTMSS